jgi:iron-sulfur cluster assembly protein
MTDLTTTRPARRPRSQAVRLTEAAAARIRQLTEAASGPCEGLRIGVKNGGCAGQEYTVDYAESVGPLDEVVEDKGARVLIDPKAILFLIGSEIDFQVSDLSSKFVFNNPNQTDACGCGESVTIVPVAQDA